VEDKGEMQVYAQVILHTLPLQKSYLYIPRGPVYLKSSYADTNRNVFSILQHELQVLAKKHNAIFLKLEPEVRMENDLARIYKDIDFIKSSKTIQPVNTLILNITDDEDEILKQMHHKTRYNIRLASRRGVVVRTGDVEKDLASYYDLMLMTARRDNFKPHSKKYYYNQLVTLGKDNLIKLMVAEHDGKVIAGLIVAFYGKRATYLHGAMDGKYRKLMGPHLLQWEAIKLAKQNNCTQYDFWGIAPAEHDEEHAWAGITRFKEGFGGEKYYLAGSLDYIYQPFWYRIYIAMSQKKA
jgi:lipid II:glycine glycyltransferase (peptidoglycan interpeptide bridge formation enzyme)